MVCQKVVTLFLYPATGHRIVDKKKYNNMRVGFVCPAVFL